MYDERLDRELVILLAVIPDRLDRLEELCRRVRDWDALIQTATAHDVLGLLWWALGEIAWRLPERLADRCRRTTTAHAMSQLRVRASLSKVLESLSTAGVRCAAFKGPDITDRAYPRGVVRPCSDLDVLIDPANRHAAERAMRELGYLIERPTPWQRYESFRHEIRACSDKLAFVELHQHVNSAFGVAVPTGPLLDAARNHKLAFADALMAVTLHGSASLFRIRKWLMDVKLMCLAASSEDMAHALVRARELRVFSAVVFGFRTAQRIGAPTHRCLPRPRYRHVRRRLAQALHPSVARDAAQAHLSPMPVVHALLCDSVRSWPTLFMLRVWVHVARDKGAFE